mgnify:CR=1 FL=1
MISVRSIVSLMLAQTAGFVAAGLGLWIWSGRSASAFVSFGWHEFALGLALAGALIAIAAATFFGLPKLSEYLVRAQAPNLAFLERPLPFWAVVWISLGAGVGEEALFRGGVQTLAGDYLGVPLAIAFASALFAVVHFAKPLVAAIIFAIGVLFGCIYWLSDSLLAVMIGHALYDVFALWYVQKEMHRLAVFEPKTESETT